MVNAEAGSSKELQDLQAELEKTQAALQQFKGAPHGLIARDQKTAVELQEAREELIQAKAKKNTPFSLVPL